MFSALFDILMNTSLLWMAGNVSGPRIELEKRQSARCHVLASIKVCFRTDRSRDNENQSADGRMPRPWWMANHSQRHPSERRSPLPSIIAPIICLFVLRS